MRNNKLEQTIERVLQELWLTAQLATRDSQCNSYPTIGEAAVEISTKYVLVGVVMVLKR